MNYLIIDTTKKIAHILAKINKLPYKIMLGENEKHSENLLPAIDEILAQAKVYLQNVDCLAVVTGPGSFTGIRVGLSTVKAFCFGQNKKVVAFSMFDVVKDNIETGMMLLSSTHSTYYMGKIDQHKVVEAKVIQKQEASFPYYALEEEKQDMPSDVILIHHIDDLMMQYVEKRIKNKEFDSIIEVEPYYLQLSQAEREWNKKQDDKSSQ